MDKCRAIPVLINFLEVNDELARIMLGVGEYFRAEEGNDVVRDDLTRFILEVGVVDAQVRVEPVDLVGDQLARDKALSAESG